MNKLKLQGKDLRKIGFPESPAISVAMTVMEQHFKHSSQESALAILKSILDNPAQYQLDGALGKIAKALMPKPNTEGDAIALNDAGITVNTFGQEHIEEGAFQQMNVAAKLPIAVAGALMPDAHHGYGLPIGGVLAVENAVIPYGVGVDIGCRMCLSIFDINPKELQNKSGFFERELSAATLFGSGATFRQSSDHEVLDRKEFAELPIPKTLHARAWKQLGSSGSGNHFAEFGIVEIDERDDILGVEKGIYVGFLTHSGSRALGANIANHYTRLAKQKRMLPQEAANLAWLSLDEAEGMEYWLSMNLAGDYASACHHVIHEKIAKQLNREPLKMVENHHNFAWKEIHEGREVIVHRKGATPAGKDVLGVIPGSMTAPGFIVKGKGVEASISSASHGAGRKMSRTAALKGITHASLKEVLKHNGVTLLGGGLDEAPFAYKDIEAVMKSQTQLVAIVGKFTPKIVKMCGDTPRQWKKSGHDKVVDGE